jgi:hypothetical protein
VDLLHQVMEEGLGTPRKQIQVSGITLERLDLCGDSGMLHVGQPQLAAHPIPEILPTGGSGRSRQTLARFTVGQTRIPLGRAGCDPRGFNDRCLGFLGGVARHHIGGFSRPYRHDHPNSGPGALFSRSDAPVFSLDDDILRCDDGLAVGSGGSSTLAASLDDGIPRLSARLTDSDRIAPVFRRIAGLPVVHIRRGNRRRLLGGRRFRQTARRLPSGTGAEAQGDEECRKNCGDGFRHSSLFPALGRKCEKGAPQTAPTATARWGSRIHSLQEPAYNREPPKPAASIASRL